MSCSPPQATETPRAPPELPAGAMAPKAVPKAGARSKSRQPSPQPPPETRHWTVVQGERLDAACEVYSGLASVSAREAMTHLYRDTVRQCVDFAQKAVRQQGGLGKGAGKNPRARSHRRGAPSPKPAPGQAQSSTDPPPFLPAYRSNELANLLQNRLGEEMPSRFHPGRHSVMIVGRPVQATTSAMPLSHEPPAMRQESDHVPLFWNSDLDAR